MKTIKHHHTATATTSAGTLRSVLQWLELHLIPQRKDQRRKRHYAQRTRQARDEIRFFDHDEELDEYMKLWS